MSNESTNYEISSEAFNAALKAIDAAHSLDPRLRTFNGIEVPYELHYAQRMTHYLHLLHPSPKFYLQLAIRAQHFKRWEVPRSSYPMTRVGYHSWRTYLKNRQAQLCAQVCDEAGVPTEIINRISALIKKEGLKQGEEDVQVLEDCACLVFLDEQLEEFEQTVDEEKMIGILRKTWGKMGERGRNVALEMNMGERGQELVKKALGA